MKGDVNKDGMLSNADVTLIEEYLADKTAFTLSQRNLANVDGNSAVNMQDVVALQRIIANIQKGDITGDGKVTAADATALQNAISKIVPVDLNNDGVIDAKDLLKLQEIIAKIVK